MSLVLRAPESAGRADHAVRRRRVEEVETLQWPRPLLGEPDGAGRLRDRSPIGRARRPGRPIRCSSLGGVAAILVCLRRRSCSFSSGVKPAPAPQPPCAAAAGSRSIEAAGAAAAAAGEVRSMTARTRPIRPGMLRRRRGPGRRRSCSAPSGWSCRPVDAGAASSGSARSSRSPATRRTLAGPGARRASRSRPTWSTPTAASTAGGSSWRCATSARARRPTRSWRSCSDQGIEIVIGAYSSDLSIAASEAADRGGPPVLGGGRRRRPADRARAADGLPRRRQRARTSAPTRRLRGRGARRPARQARLRAARRDRGRRRRLRAAPSPTPPRRPRSRAACRSSSGAPTTSPCPTGRA